MKITSSAQRLGLVLIAVLSLVLGMAGTSSASSIVDPEVWAGSPVAGTWTSDPATHHWLANDMDQGDWASDIATPAGTQVVTYIAPQNGGYTVSTRVDQIGSACVGGGGASFVNVGIYVNGGKVGSVSYAHLNPSVSVGQWISRWGAVVGTVAGGLPVNGDCWTGPHTHVQMYNVHNYSCFNRGYSIGSWLNPSNFIGFVGGNRVSGARQACP
ncbi:MAG TPA: hypothetical protein VLG40_03910 [Candidatus Saccharimonas sp.]|nr:hypothetical protein [Candidatus Saccharimonas sp.]